MFFSKTFLQPSFLVRLHNSSMQSQVDTRKEVGILMGRVAKLQEDMVQVSGFSEAAAGKVKAAEMQDLDVDLLQLKWETVEQITDACDNPAKKLAVLRLMDSGLIASDQTHVLSSALNFFIAPDLLRRLCIKMPPK